MIVSVKHNLQVVYIYYRHFVGVKILLDNENEANRLYVELQDAINISILLSNACFS